MNEPGNLKGQDSLPPTLPIFPLAGALLLPRGRLPLNIFEPRYLAMVDDALASDRLIGMIQPLRENDPAKKPEIYPIGCAGRITSFSETGDGRYLITLSGVSRFTVERELDTVRPYRRVAAQWETFAADLDDGPAGEAVDRERLLAALREYLDRNNLTADWNAIDKAPTEGLVNSLCMIAPVGLPEKQALLESPTLCSRAEALICLIEMSLAEDKSGGTPLQ